MTDTLPDYSLLTGQKHSTNHAQQNGQHNFHSTGKHIPLGAALVTFFLAAPHAQSTSHTKQARKEQQGSPMYTESILQQRWPNYTLPHLAHSSLLLLNCSGYYIWSSTLPSHHSERSHSHRLGSSHQELSPGFYPASAMGLDQIFPCMAIDLAFKWI